MKKLLILIFIIACIKIYSIEIEIENVLDAPKNNFGGFLDDRIVFLEDGTFVLESNLSSNVFILKNKQWIKLINEYKTPEYNSILDPNPIFTQLYYSKNHGEILYTIRKRKFPQENYRIFLDEKYNIKIESVDKEYLDLKKTVWGNSEELLLKNGYRLDIKQGENHPQEELPRVINNNGEIIYSITDDFKSGFVQFGWSIAVSPAKDKISMIVSFIPEKDSPYYSKAFRVVDKLVILKITYDED